MSLMEEDWNEDIPLSRENQSSYRNHEEARGGGNYDEHRRRQQDMSDEFDIKSENIGCIIGRGGCNIKRLQSTYNVHINVDKNRGSVKVSGDTMDSISSAISEIKKQINNDNNRSSERNQTRRNDYNSQRNYSENERRSTNSFNKSEGGSNWNKYRHDNEEQESSKKAKDNEAIQTNDDGIIDWDKLNERSKDARQSRWANCPPLIKNFYNEAPEVKRLSAAQVEQIRIDNNDISVSRVFKENNVEDDDDIPNPIWKFEHCFADYPDMLQDILDKKFEKPSPIQSQAWPVLLKGEDLIGIAQTGTGKTLAFLLPAMIHTEGQSTPRPERGGPNVLILAPTRELALQIEKEVNKYSFRNMKATCVYGGGDRRNQIAHIENGVEIIICTPGRLNDLIEAKVLNISTVTYLVLDEADRMLDMGFEPQIRKVLLDIRPDRQTVMTSATWPPGVRRLAQSYMNNPIQISVGSLDLAATRTVQQIIEIVDEGDKEYLIRKFIKNMKRDEKVIIFMGKKTRADDLSSDLTIEGFMCTAIHGDREQVSSYIISTS